jgi:hypothetical protein
MKQFDIRVELEKYVNYLKGHVLPKTMQAETATELEEVVKSLNAILTKTEKVHY